MAQPFAVCAKQRLAQLILPVPSSEIDWTPFDTIPMRSSFTLAPHSTEQTHAIHDSKFERDQRNSGLTQKIDAAIDGEREYDRYHLRNRTRRSTVIILSMSVSVEAQPLIAVRDVRASSRWYGRLLDADSLPDHIHRDLYDRVFSSGRLILQLHAWDEEHHPNLVNANAAPPGHGVLLWFQVNDFDSTVDRARELGAEVIEEPHVNAAPQHREIWLRDPDGYVVVIASPDGEVSS